MWDLDTLHYLNEQAEQRHLRAVARAEEASQENAPPAPSIPVYPLAVLARQLVSGPPSLAYIVELFENSDVIAAFMELVQEYLPDYEQEIRSADIDERIRLFSSYFERHYFPLNYELYDDEDSLEGFLRQIPVDLRGFSYDDYHEFTDFRSGYVLLLALIESPFYNDEGHGGRIPILTHISDLFGRDVAELIPPDGWEPAFLHQRTDGTRFDGVGVFADWVHSQTDCWVLDANYYDYDGEQWQQHIVAELTEQWPRVCEIERKITHVVEFMEANPRKRFLELLNLLLDVDTKPFIVPDEQLPLPLDFNN